jgi:hypothetical protein
LSPEILQRNRKRWKGITDGLNHEFWTITSKDVREEYFSMMAMAEREAEMRTFFGVSEGDVNAADDLRYMPLGGSPGRPDGDDDGEDEEAEALALAMQRMEKSCQDMVTTWAWTCRKGRRPRGAGGAVQMAEIGARGVALWGASEERERERSAG